MFFSQYPLMACNSLPRGGALQEFPHLHWHADWFCISKGNTKFLLSKYGVVLGCFTCDFCQVEEVCFYSYFLNISGLGFANHERLLDFVTCLFCIFSGNFVVLILLSIDKLHYMDWFSDIRLILRSWTTLFSWLWCIFLFICSLLAFCLLVILPSGHEQCFHQVNWKVPSFFIFGKCLWKGFGKQA